MKQPNITVLVVDDTADHRDLMRRSLMDAGIRVRTAATGRDALASLDGVDLVLLDQQLPGMSGLEALAEIRDVGGPSVVMVTGTGSEELVVRSIRAGAIDYLVKDGSYLRNLPENVVRAWRHHDLLRRTSELQRLALVVTSSVDRAHLSSEIVSGATTLLRAQACALCIPATDDDTESGGPTHRPPLMRVVALEGDWPGFGPADLAVGRARPGQLFVRLPSFEGVSMGLLAVLDDEDRVYQCEDVQLAEAFASFAGLGLQNMRRFEHERTLHDQLDARARQQAAVARLGQRALTGIDLEPLADESLRLVEDVLGAERARIVRAGDPDDEPAHGDVLSRASVVIPGRAGPMGVLRAESAGRKVFGANDVDFLPSVANVLAAATEGSVSRHALRYQALHDPLTGLPNRTLLLDRLERALVRARRHGTPMAVLFLDVDRFKVVNDSLGHSAGDELLVQVAARLRRAVRPADTLARFGGDEFVVLCEDVSDEATASELAECLARELRPPISFGGREVQVSISTGIVVRRPEHDDAESLLRDADAAMYRAKERGRARHEMFDPSMRQRATDRLDNEGALRDAIREGQLFLVYQHEVSLADRSTVGLEALVRWQHPVRGLLGPSDFLPVAEESGLILPLGQWVLATACAEVRDLRARQPSLERAVLWVNLSVRELTQHDLTHIVERVIEQTDTDPTLLGIEITESVFMDDLAAVDAALRGLRDLGVQLAIDDFGTGFSSLSFLRSFPVSVLKVDQSFVAGMCERSADAAIVRAVISLAHSLGLAVVAEGVETAAQLAALEELGCEFAQGYHLARPATIDRVAELRPHVRVVPDHAGWGRPRWKP